MPDLKITQLPAAAGLTSDDLFAIANDPGGVPVTQKLTAAQLSAFVLPFTPEDVANKDTDGTLAANSDIKYPSQKAVKTYVDTGLAGKQNSLGFTPEDVANKTTDGTLAANSDTLYPSEQAVKTYVDTVAVGHVVRADYDGSPISLTNTLDPIFSITLGDERPGTYSIRTRAVVELNGATFGSNETLTFQLKQQSGPGDLALDKSLTTYTVPIVTTLTETLAVVMLPEIFFPNIDASPFNGPTNTIRLFAGLTNTPSVGSVDVREISFTATREGPASFSIIDSTVQFFYDDAGPYSDPGDGGPLFTAATSGLYQIDLYVTLFYQDMQTGQVDTFITTDGPETIPAIPSLVITVPGTNFIQLIFSFVLFVNIGSTISWANQSSNANAQAGQTGLMLIGEVPASFKLT